MQRILGIDYGEKKVGFAVADVESKIAFPRETFRYEGKAELISKIKNLVLDEDIGEVVVGLPLNLKSQDTDQTKIVRKFFEDLKAEIEVDIHLHDERLSTLEAQKKFEKKETKNEDALAAQLILQSYLDKEK